MTIARDRVIGILLGDFVVYALFTSLWPVSVARRIDPAIAALLSKLGDIQFVAPIASGSTSVPAGLGYFSVFPTGRPIVSTPDVQLICSYGVEDRALPFVRSSTNR